MNTVATPQPIDTAGMSHMSILAIRATNQNASTCIYCAAPIARADHFATWTHQNTYPSHIHCTN